MYSGFEHTSLLVKKQMLRLVGGAFRVLTPEGSLVFYAKMKAFTLREDIRLYTGEDMSNEVLTIKARQIFDVSAAYDVIDATTGEKVGVLQRKGLKSIIRDEWAILNAYDQKIGVIVEDSLAILRRFINYIPQKFHVEINAIPVCTYKQNFNPFTLRLSVDFSADSGHLYDRRLGIAAAILLCAIEGKQD